MGYKQGVQLPPSFPSRDWGLLMLRWKLLPMIDVHPQYFIQCYVGSSSELAPFRLLTHVHTCTANYLNCCHGLS